MPLEKTSNQQSNTVSAAQLQKTQLLEELSLNALPALQTVCLGGWLVRFGGGYTRRANSVTPLYPVERLDQPELLAKIQACEELYRAQHLPAVFKLTAASHPPELDQTLADAGYIWHDADAVSVQTLNLQTFAPLPASPIIEFSSSPVVNPAWFAAYSELNGLAEKYQQTLYAILSNIRQSCNFLTVKLVTADDVPPGQIAAVGLAVAERGYVGLFDIVTAANLRKQGLGRQLVNELLRWGKQEVNANEAYLQVVESNEPARQLYQQLGFADTYRYWYRIKPLAELNSGERSL